jgi:hypothetical protein
MIFGIIIGILISILIILTTLICRTPINQVIARVNSNLPHIKEKGFIVEPQSDEEERREEILKRNKKEGKLTKLNDLYDITEE